MITPYRVDVAESELDELRRRLRDTRWPDDIGDDWERGTRPSALRRLLDHWAGDFDWRAVEERLNAYEQVLVGEPGAQVHVMLAGPTSAPPLLLLHGWPDSILRFDRLLPLLADRFRLIVPSLPGYGFSDRPTAPGAGPEWVADRLATVMSELGVDRYGVHGGDIGSGIAERMAVQHPQRVTRLHLLDVPSYHLVGNDLDSLEPHERDWIRARTDWRDTEGAYSTLQRTKPQTLAAGLTDSPAGLASWFLEKFHAWIDGDDPFESIGLDTLAANATIYWVTRTAGSAARYYFEARVNVPDAAGRVRAPTGFAIFPADIMPAPRSLAERWYDVQRWTEMPRGGHFGALEQPELLAEELREFFG